MKNVSHRGGPGGGVGYFTFSQNCHEKNSPIGGGGVGYFTFSQYCHKKFPHRGGEGILRLA